MEGDSLCTINIFFFSSSLWIRQRPFSAQHTPYTCQDNVDCSDPWPLLIITSPDRERDSAGVRRTEAALHLCTSIQLCSAYAHSCSVFFFFFFYHFLFWKLMESWVPSSPSQSSKCLRGVNGGGHSLSLVSPHHRRVMRCSCGSVLRAIWDQTRSDRFNKAFSGSVTVLCSRKRFLTPRNSFSSSYCMIRTHYMLFFPPHFESVRGSELIYKTQ